MRTIFQLASFFIVLVTLVLWLFGGPNLGWTKTSVMVETIDPVTDQKGVQWENRVLPGVDFLAGGALAAGVVFGSSFLFRKK